MSKYEILFIVRPDVPEDEIDKLIAQMQTVVTSANGQVEKVDKMGRRRLAYKVAKFREGFYVLFVLEGTGETVREFERRLRVFDTVLKYITVNMDEILKRGAKFKALRTRQEAKKPKSKVQAAPPAAAAPQPSVESA
jgi:small subunit ribosomal protein S6